MFISYGWKVLYTATRGLATGKGRIQEHIAFVFTNYLAARIGNLKLDDVRRRMTVVPAAGHESAFDMTPAR